MTMLGAGLLIWIAVHLFPSVLPETRNKLQTRLGNGPYQGLFALLILAGLLLIVFGWRAAEPNLVYLPPTALRLPASVLTVIGLILMVAASFPGTRIKRFIRHPQLTGVNLWAVAHLLCNGDSRSLLLFGAIGAWTLVSIWSINRRDGAWDKPASPDGWKAEILIVFIGLAVSALAIYFHQYLAGVALIA